MISADVDKNAFLIWTATSLGLLVSTFVVLWGEGHKFSRTVKAVQDRYNMAITNIEKDVRRFVDTSIVFRENQDEMRKLLLPDLTRFYESPEREIVILGADLLRPGTGEFSELQDALNKQQLSDEEKRRHYDYGLIFNRILAPASPKILRRFIYLFSVAELKGRTPDFLEKYFKWLEDQVNFLRINQNYTIIRTPRAPVWGAPKSIIFFENVMAEVFFKGGGITLTSRSGLDESVVHATRKSLVTDYVDAIEGAPPRKEYSQLNLNEFEQYVNEMKLSARAPNTK